MPPIFDFGAALQGGLGAQQSALGQKQGSGRMDMLGGALGGLGTGLSGITASNGKPMESYGLTLDKVREMIKAMPKPVGSSVRIPVHEPLTGTAITGELPSGPIKFIEVE